MSLLDQALKLVRDGFAVFPLRAGTRDGHLAKDPYADLSTRDEARVRELWTAADGAELDHNVAIDCSYDLVALDVDVKKGATGFEDLMRAENELGQLPTTRRHGTPTGGEHWFFRVPAPVGQARVFGKHIDVRGFHGYVVGAGRNEAGEYVVLDDAPIADFPIAWYERLKQAPTLAPQTLEPLCDLDTPAALEAARAYLSVAPPAIQGSHGDDQTILTIRRVRDCGISQGEALPLLIEHWNDRCSPPWTVERLEYKVASAYKTAKLPAGIDNPLAQFGDVELPSTAPPAKAIEAPGWFMKPINTARSMADTPRRQWVMHNMLLRGAISSLVAPGASGKSTLTIAWGVALATGRGELVGGVIPKPSRVGFINNEDPEVEFERRLDACLIHNKIGLHELEGRLVTCGGSKFNIASRDAQQRLKMTPDAGKLQAFIKQFELDVVVIDPFVETHEGDENNNVEMSRVIRLYREIAENTNVAICLVHHSKKPPQASSDGFAESMDAGRGASAVINAVRVGMNFFPMSANDAKDANIDSSQRYKYARLDSVRANLFLSDGQPAWFEKISVQHENGETYGVLVPCKLETANNLEANSFIDALIACDGNDALDAGLPFIDAAVLIAHEAFIAHLAGDTKEIAARLKVLFKGTREWNGYQCFSECEDENAKRKVYVLRLIKKPLA